MEQIAPRGDLRFSERRKERAARVAAVREWQKGSRKGRFQNGVSICFAD
jgi:hypothetical protein